MHSFPADENEDAFSVTGLARPAVDPVLRRTLEAQFLAERALREPPEDFDEQELFVSEIDRSLHTLTAGHGDPQPRHRIWRAP